MCESVCVCVCESVCVCVCVSERERERECVCGCTRGRCVALFRHMYIMCGRVHWHRSALKVHSQCVPISVHRDRIITGRRCECNGQDKHVLLEQ